jgi:TolB-like protein
MTDEEQSKNKDEGRRLKDEVAKSSGISAFWVELKRRHVVRVAMVYAIVGWLVIQVANATFSDFGIPVWACRFVVLMVVLGFPISVVIAWAFELTPEGIKTTKTAKKETEVSESHAKKRNWFSLVFAAAVPTLIFGIAAGVFYVKFQKAEKQGQISEQTDYDKSIAILPFANLSPDDENAFFADGVHEDILTNLAHIRDLLVISRTSTLRYRDSVKSSPEIGKELGVRYLVEGSVRRVGNRVRVIAQLIDSKIDQHIWAQNYTKSLDDIFAIQSEMA